jgi:hypothetical protein
MISSVTTTVSSVVTSTSIVAWAGLLAVLCLIAFLVTKELVGASPHGTLRALSRVLNVAVVPLLMVFSAVVVAKVVAILSGAS